LSAGPADNPASKPDRTFLPSLVTPQAADLEVIGPARVRLYLQASVPDIDLHARLCDVTPRSRSINLCDGIVRLTDAAPDTPQPVEFDLCPSRTRSGAGTGSGCRSPAAPIPATDATTAPQKPSPLAHAYRRATAQCSTMPGTPRQCGYPCAADLQCLACRRVYPPIGGSDLQCSPHMGAAVPTYRLGSNRIKQE
jgi:hypothetical protein